MTVSSVPECDRRMCHKRPYGNGGECSQFWFLILNPLTLHGMGSVRYRLQSLPLVPIWLALPELLTGEILGQIQVNTGCASKLGIFRIFSLKSSFPHPFIGCCTSVIMTLIRKSK